MMRLKTLKLTRYLTIAILLIISQQSFAKLNEFQFKFGILELGPNNTLIVKKETRNIPLITKEKGFIFGFIINKINGGKFNGQLIVHFPSKPNKLTGKAKNINIKPNNTLTIPISYHNNYWSEASWFDKGDPAGIWKYTIFINGKLFKEVEFEVTP